MNNQTNIKHFINNFNFPNPNWNEFPKGFPFCDTSSLNKQESGLYSGIVFAWLVYRSEGMGVAGKILFYLFIFTLITGNLINYILIEVYHSIL